MQQTQLARTELGSTGLEITGVGLGAWAIGGSGYDWGWGRQDDEDSIAAIHHALELGVNWIDTAARRASGIPSRSSAGRWRASTSARTCSPRPASPRGRGERP